MERSALYIYIVLEHCFGDVIWNKTDVEILSGTQQTWFNTFNTSSEVSSTIVAWPDDGEFHSVSATLRTIEGNTDDLSIQYYLDGVLQATDVGAGFYGAAMYL